MYVKLNLSDLFFLEQIDTIKKKGKMIMKKVKATALTAVMSAGMITPMASVTVHAQSTIPFSSVDVNKFSNTEKGKEQFPIIRTHRGTWREKDIPHQVTVVNPDGGTDAIQIFKQLPLKYP